MCSACSPAARAGRAAVAAAAPLPQAPGPAYRCRRPSPEQAPSGRLVTGSQAVVPGRSRPRPRPPRWPRWVSRCTCRAWRAACSGPTHALQMRHQRLREADCVLLPACPATSGSTMASTRASATLIAANARPRRAAQMPAADRRHRRRRPDFRAGTWPLAGAGRGHGTAAGWPHGSDAGTRSRNRIAPLAAVGEFVNPLAPPRAMERGGRRKMRSSSPTAATSWPPPATYCMHVARSPGRTRPPSAPWGVGAGFRAGRCHHAGLDAICGSLW